MLPSTLEKLKSTAAQAREEATAKASEADAAVSAALQLEKDALTLDRAVDNAFTQLNDANAQAAAFQAQISQLTAYSLDAWGKTEYNGQTILTGFHYSTVANAERALQDWPRIREHLTQKLELAQAALAEFEREHA